MDISMELSGLILILGAFAAIGGGLVLFRQSKRVGWRAVGMSAVALGIGVFLVVAITVPVTSEGEAPEPQIATDVAIDPQPTPPVPGPGSVARPAPRLPARFGSGPSVQLDFAPPIA